ncbi:hypothetical protein [Cellulosimicrobium composti]|uniref:hypothetical protein n=1 Tax=Cellulosimicrobium composti TaxID=2672572 RepID=UPI0037AC6031
MIAETVPDSAVTIDGEDYTLATYQQQWTTCTCTDRLHRIFAPWLGSRLAADRIAAMYPEEYLVTRIVATTTATGVPA